jgi:hypothetical protein
VSDRDIICVVGRLVDGVRDNAHFLPRRAKGVVRLSDGGDPFDPARTPPEDVRDGLTIEPDGSFRLEAMTFEAIGT